MLSWWPNAKCAHGGETYFFHCTVKLSFSLALLSLTPYYFSDMLLLVCEFSGLSITIRVWCRLLWFFLSPNRRDLHVSVGSLTFNYCYYIYISKPKALWVWSVSLKHIWFVRFRTCFPIFPYQINLGKKDGFYSQTFPLESFYKFVRKSALIIYE